MLKNTLKVAILGTGYIGKCHMEIWRKLGVSLCLCTSNTALGEASALSCGAPLYTDYRVMYEKEKPDAVSVCLPTHLHYDAVKEALERNIAVLCEKPFVSDTAQAKELCLLAEKKGCLLMVGHPLRFSREYNFLRNSIRDKRYGELRYLHLFRHMQRPSWSSGNWLTDTSLSGGAVRDLHIHESDLILFLLGMPQSVMSLGDTNICTTMYTYESGIPVSSTCSWRNAEDYPFTSGFDAVFESGSVVYDGTNLTVHTAPASFDRADVESVSPALEGMVPMENEIRYFCRCLRENMPPDQCPPAESTSALRLNDAELHSLKHRKTIEIL